MSLSRAGYSCTCVYDGTAAADLLEENVYDLILLDVMLPGVDGFELMDYIRPLGIPVIFITARNSVTDRDQGPFRMGADDYIVKPFEVVELLARVDVMLRLLQQGRLRAGVGGLTIDTAACRCGGGTRKFPSPKRNMTSCCSLPGTRARPCTGKPFMSGSGAANIPAKAGR